MTNSLIYSINVDLIPEFAGSRRRICQRIGRELVRHFPYAEQTLPREHAFVDEPTPETGRLPLPKGHKGRQGYFHQSSSQVCASLFSCLFLMLSNFNLCFIIHVHHFPQVYYMTETLNMGRWCAFVRRN